MRKSTKIFLAIFLPCAVILYLAAFVFPDFGQHNEKTVVIEYGDLPVSDEEEVLLIRSETLFSSAISGAPDYIQKEGTKVRKGVNIMSLGGGSPKSEDEEDGEEEETDTEKVKNIAGGALEPTPDFSATETATLSYYADGYEKVLTPGAIASIEKDSIGKYADKCVSLKSEYVQSGDPVYKLTDGNLWYMVFWIDASSGSIVNYDEGGKVKVDMGDASVEAVIDSVTTVGDSFKVVLRSDKYYDNMTKIRKTKAKIVFAEYKGLIIDAKSIALREVQPGVFVKQRTGNFKWVPISIEERHSTGDKKIVAVGTFTDEKGDSIRTVNYYDEIIKDPKEEGYS